MLIVLRLRNPDLIYPPHSTSDRFTFQIRHMPLVVYTSQTHSLLLSFGQSSNIWRNTNIILTSPRKDFRPYISVSFAARVQSPSNRCVLLSLWFRREQGEKTGSFGSLAFCWCKNIGIWRWHPFPSGSWQQWKQFPPVWGGVAATVPVMIVSSSGQFFSMDLGITPGSLSGCHFSSPPRTPQAIQYPFEYAPFLLSQSYALLLRTKNPGKDPHA